MSDLPPQALEAEKAVLGCALLDTAACRWVADNLVAGAFYQERNRVIFQALGESFRRHGTADLTLVYQGLINSGQVGDAGGKAYLKEVLDSVASSNFTEHYGKLVLRAYYDRQVLREAAGLGQEEKREEALERIARIFRARDLLESRGVVSLGQSLGRVVDQLGAGPSVMLGTGFKSLDAVLGGSEAGDLLTIGARTGVGKTAFLICLAVKLAEAGKRVAFFAGEMGPDQVTKRALASRAKVEHWRVRTRRVNAEDAARIMKAAADMQPLEVHYCGLPSPRLQDIKATCDAARADVAVIDYLTRCTLPQAESMRVSVNKFMVGLKNFARETGLVAFLAAQVNRLTDKTPDAPPTLSDLKESGAIEEESDVVVLMHVSREDKHQEGPVPLKLAVAKNRHGRTGVCEVVFDRRYMEVRDGADEGHVLGVGTAFEGDSSEREER